MVGTLIAARVVAEMDGGSQHSGMLAGAIIVDRERASAALHQIAKGLVADRPMGAAGEIALVKPSLRKKASHRIDMRLVAAMRGASDRKLGVTEPERVRRATLDQGKGLKRFHG